MVADYELEQLRETLKRIGRGRSFLQGKSLDEKLMRKTKLPRDVVLNGLKLLQEKKEISCDSWFRGAPISKVYLQIEDNFSTEQLEWYKVLAYEGVANEDKLVLAPLADYVVDLNKKDQCLLLKGLFQIRETFEELKGKSAYLVSARYLLGSSKLLGALPANILHSFGRVMVESGVQSS